MPNAGRDEGANTERDEGANTGRGKGANAGTGRGRKRRNRNQSGRQQTAAFINHTVVAD